MNPPRPSNNDDDDTSLDEVFSGERPVLFPPGAWAAAPVVPLLGIGSAFLVFEVVDGFWGGDRGSVANADLGTLGCAVGITIVLSVFQGAVILGRSGSRRFLEVIAKTFLFLQVIASGLLAVKGSGRLATFAACGAAAIGLSLFLVRSAAYLEFATFFALKREYKERQRAFIRTATTRRRVPDRSRRS
jgi:hypothetical protein